MDTTREKQNSLRGLKLNSYWWCSKPKWWWSRIVASHKVRQKIQRNEGWSRIKAGWKYVSSSMWKSGVSHQTRNPISFSDWRARTRKYRFLDF